MNRVGALLAAFSEEESVLSLGVCAERAVLSKSSAHRLLGALEEIGLVERDGAAGWQIGAMVLRLAAIRLSHRSIRSEVMAGLRELGRRYEAATAFSVPYGNEMVYVERTDSPLPFAPAAKLGSVAPMWAGAAGRAVLSALPVSERASRIESPEWFGLAENVRENVIKEIEHAAERGYSIDRGQFFDGVAGVAVPLGQASMPVAAASLIMSPDRMSATLAKEIGKALQELVSGAAQSALLLASV